MQRNSVGVLISTYNWPGALELIFVSISNQTVLPQEILIADDGSNSSTKALIDKYSALLSIPIKYSWQQDEGFRKSLILNKAIKLSEVDYIIQIDGDIVLHPRFIEDHINHARPSTFIQGSRVMIGQQATKNILDSKNININWFSKGIRNRLNSFRAPFLSFMFKAWNQKSRRIKACNLSFWKSDYIMINGYDNQFSGWGWEDDEFAARLVNAGISKNRLKFAAICYHLHHDMNPRTDEKKNKGRYQETVRKKTKFAISGFREI